MQKKKTMLWHVMMRNDDDIALIQREMQMMKNLSKSHSSKFHFSEFRMISNSFRENHSHRQWDFIDCYQISTITLLHCSR